MPNIEIKDAAELTKLEGLLDTDKDLMRARIEEKLPKTDYCYFDKGTLKAIYITEASDFALCPAGVKFYAFKASVLENGGKGAAKVALEKHGFKVEEKPQPAARPRGRVGKPTGEADGSGNVAAKSAAVAAGVRIIPVKQPPVAGAANPSTPAAASSTPASTGNSAPTTAPNNPSPATQQGVPTLIHMQTTRAKIKTDKKRGRPNKSSFGRFSDNPKPRVSAELKASLAQNLSATQEGSDNESPSASSSVPASARASSADVLGAPATASAAPTDATPEANGRSSTPPSSQSLAVDAEASPPEQVTPVTRNTASILASLPADSSSSSASASVPIPVRQQSRRAVGGDSRGRGVRNMLGGFISLLWTSSDAASAPEQQPVQAADAAAVATAAQVEEKQKAKLSRILSEALRLNQKIYEDLDKEIKASPVYDSVKQSRALDKQHNVALLQDALSKIATSELDAALNSILSKEIEIIDATVRPDRQLTQCKGYREGAVPTQRNAGQLTILQAIQGWVDKHRQVEAAQPVLVQERRSVPQAGPGR